MHSPCYPKEMKTYAWNHTLFLNSALHGIQVLYNTPNSSALWLALQQVSTCTSSQSTPSTTKSKPKSFSQLLCSRLDSVGLVLVDVWKQVQRNPVVCEWLRPWPAGISPWPSVEGTAGTRSRTCWTLCGPPPCTGRSGDASCCPLCNNVDRSLVLGVKPSGQIICFRCQQKAIKISDNAKQF